MAVAFLVLCTFVLLPQLRRQLAASAAFDAGANAPEDPHEVRSRDGCPVGWMAVQTTGDGASIDGDGAGQPAASSSAALARVRCLRMSTQFGTHHECTTQICQAVARAARGGPLTAGRGHASAGGGRNATLARLSSAAESRWVREALL